MSWRSLTAPIGCLRAELERRNADLGADLDWAPVAAVHLPAVVHRVPATAAGRPASWVVLVAIVMQMHFNINV